MVAGPECANTFKDHRGYTEDDQPEQDQIKGFACLGIGAKNNGVYFCPEPHLCSKVKKRGHILDTASSSCFFPTLFGADCFYGTYIGACAAVSTQFRVN